MGVLDDRQKVHYQPVKLGRDYGAEVGVADGLTAGQTVSVRRDDDLPEDSVVEPAASAK